MRLFPKIRLFDNVHGVDMTDAFSITPIGYVRKQGESVVLDIDEVYHEAMLGLEQFSHITVFYWFDRNDTQQDRSVLRVHPCRNPKNPLTGVFATHSPLRPNLIGTSLCRIISVRDMTIMIDNIDAFDGSPVIDIKCYFPPALPRDDFRIPDWDRK